MKGQARLKGQDRVELPAGDNMLEGALHSLAKRQLIIQTDHESLADIENAAAVIVTAGPVEPSGLSVVGIRVHRSSPEMTDHERHAVAVRLPQRGLQGVIL